MNVCVILVTYIYLPFTLTNRVDVAVTEKKTVFTVENSGISIFQLWHSCCHQCCCWRCTNVHTTYIQIKTIWCKENKRGKYMYAGGEIDTLMIWSCQFIENVFDFNSMYRPNYCRVRPSINIISLNNRSTPHHTAPALYSNVQHCFFSVVIVFFLRTKHQEIPSIAAAAAATGWQNWKLDTKMLTIRSKIASVCVFGMCGVYVCISVLCTSVFEA